MSTQEAICRKVWLSLCDSFVYICFGGVTHTEAGGVFPGCLCRVWKMCVNLSVLQPCNCRSMLLFRMKHERAFKLLQTLGPDLSVVLNGLHDAVCSLMLSTSLWRLHRAVKFLVRFFFYLQLHNYSLLSVSLLYRNLNKQLWSLWL